MLDVKTLCLGLLSRGEASGYDLKKDFESLFRHFFPAGYGSIYPALAGLALVGDGRGGLHGRVLEPALQPHEEGEAGD